MSLQGSLDTFALPDVLVLLASTSKTGELHVAGNRGPGGPKTGDLQGLLWLEKGKLVGFDVARAEDAASAVFELLRLTDGSFSFMAGSAPQPNPPLDIEPVLGEAQAYLKEWQEIARVVPSLSAWVSLAPEAPAAHVSMRAEQWRLIVAIGGGCEVARIVGHLGQGELGGCRAVKELAEAGLVDVGARGTEAATSDFVGAEAHMGAPEDGPVADSDLFRMVNGPATSVVDESGSRGPVFDSFTSTSLHVVTDAPEAGLESAEAETPEDRNDAVSAEQMDAPAASAADAIIGERGGETLADFENLVTLPSRARKPRLDADNPASPAKAPAESRRTLSAKLEGGRKTAAAAEKLEAQALARQLASLGDDPQPDEHAGVEVSDGGPVAAGDDPEGDEPLNRGLLLKFLSSVRN